MVTRESDVLPFWPRLRIRWDAFADRYFPDRQIIVRADRGDNHYLRLTQRLQLSVTATVLVLTGWLAVTTISFLARDAMMASKDQAALKARQDYETLATEMGDYRRRFASLSRELEQNNAQMTRMAEQNATLVAQLKGVEQTLASTEQEKAAVARERERLRQAVAQVENQMGELGERNGDLKNKLTSAENRMINMLAERNKAVSDSNDLRGRVKDLEHAISQLSDSEQEVVQRLTEHTMARIDTMEQVLGKTGVKLDRMLGKGAQAGGGAGGPFIAAKPDERRPEDRMRVALANLDLHIDRWVNLQQMVQTLPLVAPVDYYYVGSGYGKRRDPFNNKWAMHYGLDLITSKKTTAYATAPGVVSFAGWKPKYGKIVEITHASGITTLYAHLESVSVKKGQKVGHREPIGTVGNTGRSSGTHLHYEIQVNGKAVDPQRFIKAGRYVFQG